MSQNVLSNCHGCRHEPLLRIPLSQVVVDELHMMLRITDILVINLIEDATDYDAKEKNGSIPKSDVSHIDERVKCITRGVTLRIWETRIAAGKGTGRLEFTSLMGEEKKTYEMSSRAACCWGCDTS